MEICTRSSAASIAGRNIDRIYANEPHGNGINGNIDKNRKMEADVWVQLPTQECI